MRYKGYTIKLNLQNKTVRFYNDIDDCNIYIGLFINKTLKQIELIILDMIDKRIKYLNLLERIKENERYNYRISICK
jgi:hypothetical protein